MKLVIVLFTILAVTTAEAGKGKIINSITRFIPGTTRLHPERVAEDFFNAVATTRKQVQDQVLESAARGHSLMAKSDEVVILEKEFKFAGEVVLTVDTQSIMTGPKTYLRVLMDTDDPTLLRNAADTFGKNAQDWGEYGALKSISIEITEENQSYVLLQVRKFTERLLSGNLNKAVIIPFKSRSSLR